MIRESNAGGTVRRRPLRFFDHHGMHAYTGFVLSGYTEALALPSDYGAYTCPITMGVFRVRTGRIDRMAAASVSDRRALAGLYTEVTALLGFTSNRYEGKITGLAAYGQPSADCRARLWDLHRRIQEAEHRLYDWVGFPQRRLPAVRPDQPVPDGRLSRRIAVLRRRRGPGRAGSS